MCAKTSVQGADAVTSRDVGAIQGSALVDMFKGKLNVTKMNGCNLNLLDLLK